MSWGIIGDGGPQRQESIFSNFPGRATDGRPARCRIMLGRSPSRAEIQFFRNAKKNRRSSRNRRQGRWGEVGRIPPGGGDGMESGGAQPSPSGSLPCSGRRAHAWRTRPAPGTRKRRREGRSPRGAETPRGASVRSDHQRPRRMIASWISMYVWAFARSSCRFTFTVDE